MVGQTIQLINVVLLLFNFAAVLTEDTINKKVEESKEKNKLTNRLKSTQSVKNTNDTIEKLYEDAIKLDANVGSVEKKKMVKASGNILKIESDVQYARDSEKAKDGVDVQIRRSSKKEKEKFESYIDSRNGKEVNKSTSGNTPKNNANKNNKNVGISDLYSQNNNNEDKPNRQSPYHSHHEIQTRKLMNKKQKYQSIWKIKNNLNQRQEAGFDFTSEEVKKFKLWKDGIIPYYIDVMSFSDKVLRDKIRNFLQIINSVTDLSFVEIPAPPDDDIKRWVFFMNRRGLLSCADHTVKNFTNKGVQPVFLGYDCMSTRGELAEAVMSIVGVPAQHNAPNRDEYIKVNMENIMPEKKYLFKKISDKEWLFHDLDYDFNSITHYDLHKYSAYGRPTIQLKKDSIDFMPPKELSFNDLVKIRMLYNYITRNKKMQASECKKLFKPWNKDKTFITNRVTDKNPRKKPDKYRLDDNKEDSLHDEINKGKEIKKHSLNESTEEYEKLVISKTDALTILSDYISDEQ